MNCENGLLNLNAAVVLAVALEHTIQSSPRYLAPVPTCKFTTVIAILPLLVYRVL